MCGIVLELETCMLFLNLLRIKQRNYSYLRYKMVRLLMNKYMRKSRKC